jgi:Domain of unknown function (DUF1707)
MNHSAAQVRPRNAPLCRDKLAVLSARREVPVMTGPDGGLAAGAGGRGHLRASHADREQVIITLKAAFVQGMLTKDEFDLRVAQTFASRTYAELAAVIDDIPPGLPTASPRGRSQPQGGQPVARPAMVLWAATAAYGAAWAFALNVSPDDSSTAPLIMLGGIVYLGVLLICMAAMVTLRREARSGGGQPPRRPDPGAGRRSSQRFPSADESERLPPGQHGHTQSSQAVRRPASRPALPDAFGTGTATATWRARP